MGGIHKKPISSMDKTARKKVARPRALESKATTEERIPIVTPEILEKARSIVKGLKIITPYKLTANLNVTYGAAKDILEKLESEGLIKLVSRNRRVAIYVSEALLEKAEDLKEYL